MNEIIWNFTFEHKPIISTACHNNQLKVYVWFDLIFFILLLLNSPPTEDIVLVHFKKYKRYNAQLKFKKQSAQLTPQEWIGLYRSMEDALLERVVSVGYLKGFSPSLVQFNVKFMSTFPKSTIGSQYFTLTHVKPNTKNATTCAVVSGWMPRVKVDRLTIGSSQTQYKLFFGKLN